MNYERNIRAWRDGASDDDIVAGRDWYPFARRMARELAAKYDVTVDTAAGVIAALSPRCSWAENLAAAETVLRARAADELPPESLPGVYGTNVAKAWNISGYIGGRYPRCDGTREGARGGRVKCNGHRDGCRAAGYLHGPKVCEFAATIGGKRDGRVMDVWATRAADVHPTGALTLAPDDPRRAGIPGNRFAELQAAYASVAADIGEDPRVTQAIVWTRIRRVWLRADGRRSGVRKSDAIPF